jgi:hypothetical protein
MAELTRGERLQIMLTKEEVEALDNWRFDKRMPSRAAAVRELLKRGLTAEGFALADKGSKSGDYGLLDGEAQPVQRPPKRSAKPADTRAHRRDESAIAMDHAVAYHRAGAPGWQGCQK